MNRHWRWIEAAHAYPMPGELFRAVEDLLPPHCKQREQNRQPPRVFVASPFAGCTMRELMDLAEEMSQSESLCDPFADDGVRPECLRAVLTTPEVELMGRLAMRKLK